MKSLVFFASLLVHASLAQKCSKTFTEKSGVLSSPGYPNNYPPNTDCYWEFERPKDGSCVLFTVEDFVVPSENEDLCPGDHFVLESCGSWWSVSPERYYCGDYTDYIGERGSFNLVQHFQINATSLRVSFHSDSVDEGKGFLMQYEILESAECKAWGSASYTSITNEGGDEFDCVAVLDDESGSFNTPRFPNPYPAEAACAYGFKRPSPEYCGVLVRTSKFDLEEEDAGSCYDYFRMPGCRKLCGKPKGVVWF